MPKTYWYAVETRVRSEYAAQREISALGFEVYLPEQTTLKRTRKGRFLVQHPLMPGFLFVGTHVPPIVDVDSKDHPHPIFQVRNLPSVRDIVRGAGGGVHPLRSKIVNGRTMNFVEDLRAREAAGAFDNRKPEDFRPDEAPKAACTESLKNAGSYHDQLAAYQARQEPTTRIAA